MHFRPGDRRSHLCLSDKRISKEKRNTYPFIMTKKSETGEGEDLWTVEIYIAAYRIIIRRFKSTYPSHRPIFPVKICEDKELLIIKT
jgi:hypothetical protein